ncbi:MAG: hypothetical protein K0U78_00210 [Actinomycetia bacterium]|nr:hypothetical protein [Actinomycetes bacterium]
MSNIVVDTESQTSEAVTTEEPTTNVTSEDIEVAADAMNNAEVTTEYQVPDKFAGKTTEEIIASYQNLEKEMGRKAQEVGELRKLSDSFLQAEVARSTQTNPQENSSNMYEEQTDDFYEDPNKAVNNAIENHPKFREFQQFQQQQVQSAAKAQLEQSHPDFGDVVKDTKFQDWVKESPIRMQMFQAADAYNFDAANELLTNWKDRSMVSKTQEVNQQQADERGSKLKAATTESRSASGSTSGKSFRRADLIRMKMEDPNKYDSLQDVIFEAYANGRVT